MYAQSFLVTSVRGMGLLPTTSASDALGVIGFMNAAFMRPVQPDDKVAPVVGAKPIPRTEVTKRLWAYIKKNGLQDKKNKRMINADDKLKAVFKKGTVNMFEMTKLVSKHLS